MIPKIIHQIWLGDKRIPKHIIEYINEINETHKEYTYYFWTDANLPKMPNELAEVYDSLEHPAMKSDLLRVYVLYLYGGIYLDVDYKLISHLDKLNLANKDAYVVCHKAEEIDNINNSIYISAKNGGLINFMLKNITEKQQWLGPHWYAECLFKYLNLENNTSHIKIMDACVNNNMGFVDWDYLNENIVNHNFLASWYPNSEWNKKFETGNYD